MRTYFYEKNIVWVFLGISKINVPIGLRNKNVLLFVAGYDMTIEFLLKKIKYDLPDFAYLPSTTMIKLTIFRFDNIFPFSVL